MLDFIKRLLLLLWSVFVAAGAFADSVTLTSTADTAIAEKWPDNNAGGNSQFATGTNLAGQRSRGLVKFNLAGQIPSNASIQSVSLTMTVVEEPISPADSTFDLHRVLVAWGEGTGTSTTGDAGRLAVTGEATWNDRLYPSTTWSSAGAAAPVDFSSTVSASKFIQGLATYTFNSTPGLVADVQQWLTDPSSNFGWIVISESEATDGTHRAFASRESSANNKPTLVVQYATPVTPTIKSIQGVGSTIQFVFTAVAGQSYTAEYRDSLTAGTWATLTNIGPPPSTTDITVTDPSPPANQRFYRVTTTFSGSSAEVAAPVKKKLQR
jgi:hypothetical protein